MSYIKHISRVKTGVHSSNSFSAGDGPEVPVPAVAPLKGSGINCVCIVFVSLFLIELLL